MEREERRDMNDGERGNGGEKDRERCGERERRGLKKIKIVWTKHRPREGERERNTETESVSKRDKEFNYEKQLTVLLTRHINKKYPLYIRFLLVSMKEWSVCWRGCQMVSMLSNSVTVLHYEYDTFCTHSLMWLYTSFTFSYLYHIHAWLFEYLTSSEVRSIFNEVRHMTILSTY